MKIMKMMKDRDRKRTCKCCGQKPAIFICHGRVRRDRDHDLCFRVILDRQKAKALAAA